MSNYDLGRTFKYFHKDKDIQTPLKDTVLGFFKMSDKSLRDKILTFLMVNFHNLIF